MIWVRWASFFMFLGVGLGAFGAHALGARMNESAKELYKTGVFYHLIHALAMFVVAWLGQRSADPKIVWAGASFVAGIVFFSGSLYALAVTGHRSLGMITPVGGLALLTGWMLLLSARL